MSDKMLKMNSQVRQKLQMQAQEMGVKAKDNIRYDSDTGYYVKGWKEHQKKKAVKAVDKGIKTANLADRVKARMKKID